MPIYEYVCDKCHTELDILLPISKSGKQIECECGNTMRRRFSLATFKIPLTGKDKVLKTLNKEDGFNFPGGEKHRKRYEQSFTKGINPEKRYVGIGF